MGAHPIDGDLTPAEEQALLRAYDDLRSLANHPLPAVRGGVRSALAEVAQTLNRLNLRYELYGNELSP